MKLVPSLEKMRSVISDDGRVARFFLLFNGGQNSAFALHYSKMALLLGAIKNTIRTMSARLRSHNESAAAEMSEILAAPQTVETVVTGRDESGEAILLIETSDSGSLSLRLTSEARGMLQDALQSDRRDSEEHAA